MKNDGIMGNYLLEPDPYGGALPNSVPMSLRFLVSKTCLFIIIRQLELQTDRSAGTEQRREEHRASR
jgi:hypothetical protein